MINSEDISVIIPVLNEEKHIKKSIECILNQQWDGNIEIVIVDGNSTDKTLEVIEDISKNLSDNRTIKVFTNPKKFIPVSLNIACKNATKDIIVRVDGHTYAPPNYISESVRILKEIDFKGIVGGRWDIRPGSDTKMAKSISIAASNPFGVGNALYRTLKDDSANYIEADTVPFGAFTKELWETLGGYDEVLLFDEDYDYNYRARKSGFKVVMNPKIVLDYFSRKNLKLLWKQYFNYGYWANKFCLKHKIVPSFRRLVPVGFVVTLILLLIIYRPLFYVLSSFYLLCIAGVSVYEGLIKRKDIAMTICLISIFPTLHFSYGIGSLLSLGDLILLLFKK